MKAKRCQTKQVVKTFNSSALKNGEVLVAKSSALDVQKSPGWCTG